MDRLPELQTSDATVADYWLLRQHYEAAGYSYSSVHIAFCFTEGIFVQINRLCSY